MTNWNDLTREDKWAFWTESERMLTDLLNTCGPYLTQDQKEMAAELIDHNEHQLAAEFLFDYLDEATAVYPDQVIDQFRAIDARLHLTGNRAVSRLVRA